MLLCRCASRRKRQKLSEIEFHWQQSLRAAPAKLFFMRPHPAGGPCTNRVLATLAVQDVGVRWAQSIFTAMHFAQPRARIGFRPGRLCYDFAQINERAEFVFI